MLAVIYGASRLRDDVVCLHVLHIINACHALLIYDDLDKNPGGLIMSRVCLLELRDVVVRI